MKSLSTIILLSLLNNICYGYRISSGVTKEITPFDVAVAQLDPLLNYLIYDIEKIENHQGIFDIWITRVRNSKNLRFMEIDYDHHEILFVPVTSLNTNYPEYNEDEYFLYNPLSSYPPSTKAVSLSIARADAEVYEYAFLRTSGMLISDWKASYPEWSLPLGRVQFKQESQEWFNMRKINPKHPHTPEIVQARAALKTQLTEILKYYKDRQYEWDAIGGYFMPRSYLNCQTCTLHILKAMFPTTGNDDFENTYDKESQTWLNYTEAFEADEKNPHLWHANHLFPSIPTYSPVENVFDAENEPGYKNNTAMIYKDYFESINDSD